LSEIMQEVLEGRNILSDVWNREWFTSYLTPLRCVTNDGGHIRWGCFGHSASRNSFAMTRPFKVVGEDREEAAKPLPLYPPLINQRRRHCEGGGTTTEATSSMLYPAI